MTQHYRLANPTISAISVDGIEHKVNPDTGLLEVEVLTPGLPKDLAHHGAELVDPARGARPATAALPPLSAEDQAEREALFVQLDAVTGRRTDRRRSLAQLREAKADAIAKLGPEGYGAAVYAAANPQQDDASKQKAAADTGAGAAAKDPSKG